MPKRPVQSPPEKKFKSNQALPNLSKTMSTSGKHNLNDVAQFGKMQNEKHVKQAATCPENDTCVEKPRIKVEYLDTPVKSENDKKEYRVIRLENGLTALLIADLHSSEPQDNEHDNKVDAISSENDDDEEEESDDGEEEEEDEGEDEEDEGDDSYFDEADGCDSDSNVPKRGRREEKMAACGLSVGVGSFSDPPEIPGLAHFLEHMVFMGSEKYPQENDFDAFVKKRGGSDNASTECEHTTFYFEVQEKHFLSALDRFAQFFISPLMKRDGIGRERKAVDSEFQMALPSDINRKEQLFCSFAQPNHPAQKFSWGNLVTLRDNVTPDKLYESLHKFRERHYSAHRMKIAIQARLSLDVLEEYVTECFSNVPNNGLPADDFTEFKGAESFHTQAFRRIYKMKPMKDVCQIELTWSMPSLHHLYKSKPHHYVTWIMGHEGKGSLISYLRKKIWCLDIVSGNGDGGFEHSSMYALFSLSLQLTDEGHKHLREVLDAVFGFINMMRKEGPQKRIYDEIYQIEDMNFRFADEVPPAENVESLCENMHFYPPRDYIAGSEIYYEYNPDAIQECMDYLTADNVNIMILDKKFNDEEFHKVEPWFGSKYAVEEIPSEWIERWKTIEPIPEFHLPLPNPFITDDFSLIPLPANVPKYPTKISANEISEIWHRPDPKFRLPECYMYFYLVSHMATSSAKNAGLMDLFIGILGQLLVDELYPATAAELNHQIYTSTKGVIIKVNGYNQKLPLVLMTIAKCIAECSTLVSKNLFEVMKKQQIRFYYNKFLKPEVLAKDVRWSILLHNHWSIFERHQAITNVPFSEFQDFANHFTDHIYIQSLVQGNMAEVEVIKHVDRFVELLKCGPLLPNTLPQIRVTEIPIGEHYCKVKNFNATDVNSVVMSYYQSGACSIRLSVLIELLIMIMEEPLFNQLRTQEQLGYNVSCRFRYISGILGYSVTVCTQANKFSTEYANERIEAFLDDFNKSLMETSVEDVESVKEALVKLKQCADVHLREETDRNWSEIVTGDYMFDRIEKEVAMIEDIKIEELREWMKNHITGGSNFRKLSIQVAGVASKPTDTDNNETAELCACDTEQPTGEIVKDGEHVKYPLLYIPITESDTKKPLGNYVTNIKAYKTGLNIYPVSHTVL